MHFNKMKEGEDPIDPAVEAALDKMDKGKLKALLEKYMGPSGLRDDAHDSGPGHSDPGSSSKGSGFDPSRLAPVPRLPSFSGSQPAKGDVKYEVWKYHVDSLIVDPHFSDSQARYVLFRLKELCKS